MRARAKWMRARAVEHPHGRKNARASSGIAFA